VDKKYATKSASGVGGAPHKQGFFNIFTAAIGSKFLVISPLLSFLKIQVLEVFNRGKLSIMYMESYFGFNYLMNLMP